MIIRKSFKAETAHRLVKAYTKRCYGLHGHSYIFEIYLKGDFQDDAQMLMDFTLVSENFKNLLDSFDHSIIAWNQDKELLDTLPNLNSRYVVVPYNTTSEQIARHIYFHGLKINLPMYKVIVHETKSSCAEFMGDDSIKFDLNEVIFSQAVRDEWQ